MPYKIDLHTHSIISYDGGIAPREYEKLLKTKLLDVIAVTDHNEIRLAQQLHKQFGDQIIVGEEIGTAEGEIIGLFLQEKIAPGRSAVETVSEIMQQQGIVYIPHPFEVLRKGLQSESLERIADKIDIVEVFNGRGKWRNRNKFALEFAQKNNLAAAASSDSHGVAGIGKTFSLVKEKPTRKNLVRILQEGSLQKTYAPLISYFEPVMNKIKNKIILTEK